MRCHLNKVKNRQTYTGMWEEGKGRGSDKATNRVCFQEFGNPLFLYLTVVTWVCSLCDTIYLADLFWFDFFWTYILLQLNIYFKKSNSLSLCSPTLPPLEPLSVWVRVSYTYIILHWDYSWYNTQLTTPSSQLLDNKGTQHISEGEVTWIFQYFSEPPWDTEWQGDTGGVWNLNEDPIWGVLLGHSGNKPD